MNKFTVKLHANPVLEQYLSCSAVLCMSILIVLLAACSARIESAKNENTETSPTQSTVTATNTVSPGASNDAVIAPSGGVAIEPRVLHEQERQVTSDQVDEIIVTGSFIRRENFNQASPLTASSLKQASPMDLYRGPKTNRENYLDVVENTIKKVSEEPLSTFSIDVDTAAYSNLRRMLTREGRLPPHDAVRLEEMINYFDYDYPTPDSPDQPLTVHTELMVSPWNPQNQLLMVGIKGYEPEAEQRPDANLVFLVDVSGSMRSPDKLGLVKRSLQMLVSQMRDEDRIALVVYAGAAGMVLDSTSVREKTKIHTAIESLTAGGSTNGAAGIELAYRIAEENKIEDGINRVIIASDGDLNVGVTSIDDLIELISKKRDNGIALTSLGYGTGNYNYSLMEQIADAGNGNAAYIDTLSEARKVLVEEMQSTLLTIAKDVKIQIEFNPDVVSEYRLLGYENRVLNREDFRNDKVDAGEIGAGHTVTALYEITLNGSTGQMIPDRRYGQSSATTIGFSDELAYISIRYKMPEQNQSTEFGLPVQTQDVSANNYEVTDNIQFAVAVAGFGQLLRGGKYTKDWNYDELLQLARQARGDDLHGYRSELVRLVELAQVL